MNRTVAALLGAAASIGALPPLPILTDRSRPESPEAQALIQQRAAAKRARRAQAYRRAQELTALGRVHSRAGVEYRMAIGKWMDTAGHDAEGRLIGYTDRATVAHYFETFELLNARRARS